MATSTSDKTISVCIDGTETFSYTIDPSIPREKFIVTAGDEINDYLTKLIKESETSEPKCSKRKLSNAYEEEEEEDIEDDS